MASCTNGHPVAEGAAYCSRCGALVNGALDPAMDRAALRKAAKDAAKLTPMQNLIGTVVFLALFGGCVAWLASAQDDPASPEAIELDAKRVCHDFVKDRLRAPASAEFSGDVVTAYGDTYLVTGTVDSQNGFGAMLRSNYRCTVEDDDALKKWRLISIEGLE